MLPLAPLLPLYILVVLLVLIILCIYGEAARCFSSWRMLRNMRAAGRTVSWADVDVELAKGSGTLIVSSPSVGWNDTDVWWTPGSVAAAASVEGVVLPPARDPAHPALGLEARMANPVFERWCLRRFIGPSTGRARLVRSTHWVHVRRDVIARIDRLRTRHPLLEVVEVSTWMVALADSGAERERRRSDAGKA